MAGSDHQGIREIYPELDRVLRRVGLYSVYRLHAVELVEVGLQDDPRAVLLEAGYTGAGVLAARKEHPSAGVYDIGSYRRVPDEHPDVDARITREWEPVECQYHAHVFEVQGSYDMCVHYELRPDFFRPQVLDLQRLQIHYRPKYGEDYLQGQPDPVVSGVVGT